MTDDAPASLPGSYYWISGAALIWNLLGLVAYVGQVTMTPDDLAAMPEAQRALYENTPIWVTSAFAIAVTAGVIGCLLLVLRKALALPVLVVSLVAVLLQNFYFLIMLNAIDVMGGIALVGPMTVIIIGFFLVWFANDAKGKGFIT